MNNFIENNFSSIQAMTDILAKQKQEAKTERPKGTSFEEILRQKSERSEGLKFSKHANERLLQRNIDLTDSQLKRLEEAAKKADEKGIRESLVMVDDLAFIVNIKNNTVITAVGESDDKIFTNIDGAVIN